MNPSTFDINQFFSGVLVTGYLVATLFFVRFLRRTHDRLFGYFAVAFGTLVVQRLLLAFTTETTEDVTYLYGIRLAAFVIILFGIIAKNRE